MECPEAPRQATGVDLLERGAPRASSLHRKSEDLACSAISAQSVDEPRTPLALARAHVELRPQDLELGILLGGELRERFTTAPTRPVARRLVAPPEELDDGAACSSGWIRAGRSLLPSWGDEHSGCAKDGRPIATHEVGVYWVTVRTSRSDRRAATARLPVGRRDSQATPP